MRFHKLLPLLALLISSSLFAQIPTSDSTLVFWKLTGNGLSKPSYIFGTIPSNDDRLFSLDPNIFSAIGASEYFSIELLPEAIDSVAKKEVLFAFLDQNVNTLFSPSKLNALQKKMGQFGGKTTYDFTGNTPLQAQLKLEKAYLHQNGRQTQEQFLLLLAREQGKKIYQLLSTNQHLRFIQRTTAFEQADILTNYMALLDEHEAYNEGLVYYYLNGDFDQLQKYLERYRHYEYIKKYRNGRNRYFLNSIVKQAELGGTFFVVDAANLVSTNGVLNGLLKKGYQLTPMSTGLRYSGDVKSAVAGSKMEPFFSESGALSGEVSLLNGQYTEDYFKAAIPNWKPVHGTGFKFRLPAVPEIVSNQIEAERGASATVTVYKYEDVTTEDFYTVSFTEYPESMNLSKKKDFFSNLVGLASKRLGGVLLLEENTSTDAYEGRAVELAIGSDFVVRTQFFRIENKLYQIMVGSSKNRAYSKANDAFLHSLQLEAASRSNEWYRLNLGTIKVSIPGNPRASSKTVTDGSLDYPFYSYRAEDPLTHIEILVGISSINSAVEVDNIDAFFNTVSYSLVTQLKAEITSEENIGYHSINGRALSLSIGDSQRYRCRFYAHEGRLFQFIVKGKAENINSEMSNRFFNSIEFGEYEW